MLDGSGSPLGTGPSAGAPACAKDNPGAFSSLPGSTGPDGTGESPSGPNSFAEYQPVVARDDRMLTLACGHRVHPRCAMYDGAAWAYCVDCDSETPAGEGDAGPDVAATQVAGGAGLVPMSPASPDPLDPLLAVADRWLASIQADLESGANSPEVALARVQLVVSAVADGLKRLEVAR